MAGEYDWISQLATGIGNLATARTDMNDAERASQMADPWASRRGQFADRLMDFEGSGANNPMNVTQGTNDTLARITALMNNPGSITSMPGYQYGLNQSLEAVNRGAGASGMLGSGNRLAALQDRGEGYAQKAYGDEFGRLMSLLQGNIAGGNQALAAQGQGFNQLAGLAGVTSGSPVAAAGMLLNGRQNQANSIGAGIGGLANGAGGAISAFLPAIQRMLGGGSGLNLGGMDPESVYGAGSGWGDDVLQNLSGSANGSWDVGGFLDADPFGIGGW
jgi:hypothetical protein